MRFVSVAVSIVLSGLSLSAQAKLYKWVDENGQMHFGDRIPEKYLVKEHEELNERGVTMKHQKAAKTPAQIEEEKRLQRERRKAELEEQKKKQRDRVLLDTYTTEADLQAARKSRLDAVDTQIRLANSIISDSNKKIISLEKQVTAIKASNREVPEDIYKRIQSQKQQVKTQERVRDLNMKRRDDIAAQFDGYIERFRILKAEQKARRERLARERQQEY